MQQLSRLSQALRTALWRDPAACVPARARARGLLLEAVEPRDWSASP